MPSFGPHPVSRVLVVGNDPETAPGLLRSLDLAEADARTCPPDLAATFLREIAPDLVLVDGSLPGGAALAADLARGGERPVVLVAPDRSDRSDRSEGPPLDRQLAAAVQQAALPVSVVATSGYDATFVACNAAFEALTGYGPRDCVGRSYRLLEGRDTDTDAAGALARALLDGRSARIELLCYRKDGSAFWNALTVLALRGSTANPATFVLIHDDVTEKKQAEQELLHTRKMDAIGQLTGGIAHDFNNILSVILAFASFVHEDLGPDDRRRDDVAEVIRAAERAMGLTRQLLTFSRQQPAAKRPLDLNASISAVLKLISQSVGEHIQVGFAASARPAIVRMDPVQVDQLVLNLAINARDAMPEGGRFHIALSLPKEPSGGLPGGRYVRLVLSDTGVGMDADVVARIFDPFFTTKPVGQGTGLGLPTCLAIIKDAGGTIEVRSARGQGTVVTVDLPVCDEPLEEPEPVPANLRSAGERVLVVEDDAALRAAVVRMLGAAGYRVTQAAAGDEAIAILGSGEPFDLILTDVVMPGSNGYAVARFAREHAPRSRVVLSSGYLDGRVELPEGLEDLPLLWKPYTHAGLLRAVHTALHGARAVAARATLDPVDRSPRTVLVIEDDAAIRAGLRRLLGRAGFEVSLAEDVASAREALGSGDFAVVLCDLSLPDGSGADVVAWLRETRPAVARRTLLLTGGALDPKGQALVSGGEITVLHKPVEPPVLLEAVRSVAEGPRVDRAPPTTIDVPAPPAEPWVGPPPAGVVLLVEDDPAQLEAYARALREAGFTVRTASSAEEAAPLLHQDRIDALATDLRLPGLDGLGLVRLAREHDPTLPILVFTGAPSVETATAAVQGRVVSYLTKPLSMAHLVQEVALAVETGQVMRLQRKLLASGTGGDEIPLDITAVRRAFDSAVERIRVVFQPIVRSFDETTFGFEALMRCDDELLSSPPKVLRAAEILGRTVDVGIAVRKRVAAALDASPERTEAIFVNLHPTELRADLLCAATEPLRRHAARVVLEVTERASLPVGAHLAEELRLLRQAGYRIAIDDLGSGYAGLSSVALLRPDIAKIDMSLVRNAHESPLKREILGSLVVMCRRAGITLVAEGIETPAEAQLLTDLGCELLQGYHFGRPGALRVASAAGVPS